MYAYDGGSFVLIGPEASPDLGTSGVVAQVVKDSGNANHSISGDISDGLFGDLTKLINKSELFYKVDLNKIPISSNLRNYLTKSKKKKINFISKGDDYQIIFTSPKSKRNYIQKFFKKMNQKVTLIGNLSKLSKNNEIIDGNRRLKHAYNEGYSHNF